MGASTNSRVQTASRDHFHAGIPPTGLVLVAIGSVQLGSALAKGLLPSLGPGGAAFLRVGWAALALALFWRPSLAGYRRSDYFAAVLFGLSMAMMNLTFYSALDRIPLGIAVTLEFVGPLGVAIAGSRRILDLLWTVFAGVGIVLLTPWGGVRLDALGMLFALVAGGFWALYIMLSARVGRSFSGGTGLTLAMVVGGVALLPFGVANAGAQLLDPRLLGVGALVALLSSVIPYSLEMEALRSLATRLFGVLMSLEPAVAAVLGFVILRQVLDLRAILALALVSAASLGASRTAAPRLVD